MKIKRDLILILKYVILTAVLFIMMYPLLYTLFASFKSNMELMVNTSSMLPERFSVENYAKIFDKANNFNFPRMILNSIYQASVNIITSVLVSAVTAYVYVRGEFPGKKIVFGVFMSLMFITTGGLTVYPTFKIFSFLHIPIGLNAMLIRGLFSLSVSHMLLVTGYIKAAPKEIDEAAEVDGCGFIGTFFRVILPNLKPIMATLIILIFNSSWNSYIAPAMYTATVTEQQTLMVGLMSLKTGGDAAANWNILLAGSVIACLPVVVIFIFFNRFITESVVGSAVKG